MFHFLESFSKVGKLQWSINVMATFSFKSIKNFLVVVQEKPSLQGSPSENETDKRTLCMKLDKEVTESITEILPNAIDPKCPFQNASSDLHGKLGLSHTILKKILWTEHCAIVSIGIDADGIHF